MHAVITLAALLLSGRLMLSSHRPPPDTTKLSCLCRVRFGGVNWIPDNSRLSPKENLESEHVQSNRPIHTATSDTTRLSRLPVDRRRRDAGSYA